MVADLRCGSRGTPAVSVIIATYRRPQLLLDCVASILENDFDDFEIIVVDQDPGGTLPAELGQRFDGDDRLVHLFLDEANLSRARNLGIKHARGRILVFSDDDIEVEKGWLRAFVDAFHSCGPEPAVVGGRLDPRWMAPKPAWLPVTKEYLLGIYNKHEGFLPMPEHDLPIGANFAVHRKVVDAVGLFDERLGYSYARKRSMIGGEDSLFSLLARKARFPLYHQGAARAWHKMSPHKLSRAYFLRRSFWEGVTLLTVLHLAGAIPNEHWHRVIRWHAREIVRRAWRLATALARGPREGDRAQEVMDAVSSLVTSAGVIRAALKLRSVGHLPW